MSRTADETKLPLGAETGIVRSSTEFSRDSDHLWTGNDESNRNHLVKVRNAYRKVSFALSWRPGRIADASVVGSFDMDLRMLVQNHLVVALEGDEYRVRFMHVGSEIRLQRARGRPYVVLGEVTFGRQGEPTEPAAEVELTAPEESAMEAHEPRVSPKAWLMFIAGLLLGVVGTLLWTRAR